MRSRSAFVPSGLAAEYILGAGNVVGRNKMSTTIGKKREIPWKLMEKIILAGVVEIFQKHTGSKSNQNFQHQILSWD